MSAELISGAKVTGSVQDSSIGTLAPATNWTGWDHDNPGTAYFTFSAKKAGTTTISFEGRISYQKSILDRMLSWAQRNDLVSDMLDVTVQDCNYKVTAISRWSLFGIGYVAIIDQAEMTADAPGHYKGTATVSWVITEVHPRAGCRPHVVMSTSQADLTGDMDKDGQQLVVDLAYQLAEATWLTFLDDCTTESSTQSLPYTPAPLTFSVPASGGDSTQSQAAVHKFYPAMNMSGSADVTAIRVTNH